jgi:hypothetical protein
MRCERFRDKHHLRPKSRGGSRHRSNLLLIEREKHVRWHYVFNRMTLEEVIELLLRVKRAKDAQGGL